jgi:nickel-dependent lactate racemase
MRLELPYGRSRLRANLSSNLNVEEISPPQLAPETDAAELVRQALARPLGSPALQEIVHRGERTTIVIPDATRVAGQEVYLPILLDLLNECGVSDRDITVLVACGSHSPPSAGELRLLVGKDVYSRVRVIAHDCQNPDDNVHLGHTERGTPVTLNKAVVKAERLIVTGAVWFHYFAGFGGGPKLINPGCAALETILENHSLTLDPNGLGLHPACRSGNLEDNPVYLDLLDSLKFVTVDFALQTVLDPQRHLVACWSGDLLACHREAVRWLLSRATVSIPARFPLVIASAGGHPHDVNLVQAHKGLLNACRFLEPGGTLIFAAECSGGAGSWGLDRCLQYSSPEELYRQLRREFILNGNTALSLLLHARAYRVILVSNLPREWLARLGLESASGLEDALRLAFQGTHPERVGILQDAAHAVPVD